MNAIERITDFPDEDVAKTLSMIDYFSEQEDKSYSSNLLKIFGTTKNDLIRNSSALVLSDWRVLEIVPKIVEIIRLKSTDQIGTLIYALSNFEYQLYLNDILPALLTGSFEAKEMVIQLLEELPDSIDENVLADAMTTLSELTLENADSDNIKYLTYASELLDAYS